MKRFKFTLVAASYTAPGIDLQNMPGQKKFSVILPEDDPRIELFRNPAFKEEPVEGLATVANPTEVDDAGTGDSTSIDAITGDLVKETTVDLLKENGYEVVADVLSEGLDGLTAIVGIGQATAEKILAAAKALAE